MEVQTRCDGALNFYDSVAKAYHSYKKNISLEKIGICQYDTTGTISAADYFIFYDSENLLVYSDNLTESVEG